MTQKEIKNKLTKIKLPDFIKKDGIEFFIVKKNILVISKLLVDKKINDNDLDKFLNCYVDNIYYLAEKLEKGYLGKIVFYLDVLIDKLLRELEYYELYIEGFNVYNFQKLTKLNEDMFKCNL